MVRGVLQHGRTLTVSSDRCDVRAQGDRGPSDRCDGPPWRRGSDRGIGGLPGPGGGCTSADMCSAAFDHSRLAAIRQRSEQEVDRLHSGQSRPCPRHKTAEFCLRMTFSQESPRASSHSVFVMPTSPGGRSSTLLIVVPVGPLAINYNAVNFAMRDRLIGQRRKVMESGPKAWSGPDRRTNLRLRAIIDELKAGVREHGTAIETLTDRITTIAADVEVLKRSRGPT